MEAIDNREILRSAKENRSARVGWGPQTVVFGLAHSYGNEMADLLVKDCIAIRNSAVLVFRLELETNWTLTGKCVETDWK